jgi:hypothetical protein
MAKPLEFTMPQFGGLSANTPLFSGDLFSQGISKPSSLMQPKLGNLIGMSPVTQNDQSSGLGVDKESVDFGGLKIG